MDGLREPSEAELLKLNQKNLLIDALGSEGQQIVVVGDTSTGKSTTINFLLGYPINFEARGIGTRRPCVISQVQDKSCEEVIYVVNFIKAKEGIDNEVFTEIEQVAQRVADANDAANKPHYFDVLLEDPSTDLEQAFDMTPIFVTMKHKDFKYGLRLVDLPGLTRKSNGPKEIAWKYVQPGNIAILVMGNDNPNNGGFPELAERMAECSQVLFIQNFANRNLESGMAEENFTTIKKLLSDCAAKGSENAGKLASTLKFYEVDCGFPKSKDFIERGQWQEGRDQEDWQEIALQGCEAVQKAMYTHSIKWADRLRENHKMMFDKYSFGAGVKEILERLIEFQFEGIDAKVLQYQARCTEMIEEEKTKKSKLEDLVKELDDPPQWQELLSKVALVVSEFLDTTIAVPEEGDGDMREVVNCLKTTEEEGRLRDDDEEDDALYGAAKKAWVNEALDKEILGLLRKYANFEDDKPLACLRSWYRLLDELIAMLAFAPMPHILHADKLHAQSVVSSGVAASANRMDVMVDLVSGMDGKGDFSGIRSMILHFTRRLKRIAKRDLHNAMILMRQDKYNAIGNFLQLVDDDNEASRQKLLNDIEEVIMQHMRETFKSTICGDFLTDANGDVIKDEVTEKPKIAPNSGICVRDKPDHHEGPVHWLLPFKGHYFNGQIPWKDLRLGEEICTELGMEIQNLPPPGMPEPVPPELVEEVSDNKSINACNSVNLEIFRLCTTMYDINVGINDQEMIYSLEVMKLLKAMQGEVATFWASNYVGMIQKMVNRENIRSFMTQKLKTDLKEAGMVMEMQNLDDWGKAFLGDEQSVHAVTKYFSSYHFDREFMLDTKQEIELTQAALAKNKEALKNLPSGELEWPGLTNQTFYKVIEGEEVRAMSRDGFPTTSSAKLAGQAAWKRLCQEFMFVVLQLSMKPVTTSELAMAKASRGKQINESPQEIITKLVCHRLQTLGQNAGIVWKHRFIFLYKRMVTTGLGEWMSKRQAAKGPGAQVLPDVAGKKGEEWLDKTFEVFVTSIVDAMLGKLAEKFDELTPFDWTTLNGRFPFGTEPIRKTNYEINQQGATKQEEGKTMMQIERLWTEPLRYSWKELMDPEPKFFLVKDAEVGGVALDDATNKAAFTTLTSHNSEGAINNSMTCPDLEPPNGDRELAGGPFHEMALRVHKSMAANAIDYCKPRLKNMMAQVYQEENLRTALQGSSNLSYKERYGHLAEKKKKELGDCEARVKELDETLVSVKEGKLKSGAAGQISEAQLAAKAAKLAAMEAARNEELESQLEALKASESQVSDSIETLQGQNAEFKKSLTKYISLEQLSSWGLSVQKISVSRLPSMEENTKIILEGFYFQQGWNGRDMKTTINVPKDAQPYQWLFSCDPKELTSNMEWAVEDFYDSRAYASKMAGLKLPNLFPPQDHFIAIKVKAVTGQKARKRDMLFGGGGQVKEVTLGTIAVPLAYALRDKEKPLKGLEQVGVFGPLHSLPNCGEAFKMEDRTSGGNTNKTWKFTFEEEMKHFGMTGKDLKGAVVEVTMTQKQERTTTAAIPKSSGGSSGGGSKFKPPARTFAVGDKVNYWSEGKKGYFPATITKVHSDGYEIDLKPGAKIEKKLISEFK